MENTEIHLAKAFSKFPAGRYKTDGPYSGQAFRENYLRGPLREGKKVVVFLDGTAGYGSSFLEEAFGGLVREEKISEESLKDKLSIKTEYENLETRIWKYIEAASQENSKSSQLA